MKNILDLLSRIFISLLFLVNGYFKIRNYDGTLEWMEGYNVPGILLVYVSITSWYFLPNAALILRLLFFFVGIFIP